ncbi:ankyrin repeat domain-containing protein [Wolbachia endosymbiont of Cantharis cryptica]|uniref:ankyrin repeat domain-containing protein n=1 Tax=Wolbachia endosymbiont of Cantharis cryptica TaxID=3066132 RepID=UPI00376EFFBC
MIEKVDSGLMETSSAGNTKKHPTGGNVKNNSSATLLHTAVAFGNMRIVESLINKMDDDDMVNTKNRFGSTPLHLAVAWREPEMVSLLIERGADIEAKDNNGKTPLHLAVAWREPEMVSLLIERGADIEAMVSKLMLKIIMVKHLYTEQLLRVSWMWLNFLLKRVPMLMLKITRVKHL